MATYDELMVYKQAYDLTIDLMLLTKKMDKAYKFTVGERINNACVEMLLCVYRINTVTDRESSFVKAREQVELIRLLLRLMKDLKIIATPRFSRSNEYVESISKQLTGWHNGTKSNNRNGSHSAQRSMF